MTDREYDQKLSNLVGEAVTSGVNQVVVIGCLTLCISDVTRWKERNDALLRTKASDMVSGALTVLETEGGQNGVSIKE